MKNLLFLFALVLAGCATPGQTQISLDFIGSSVGLILAKNPSALPAVKLADVTLKNYAGGTLTAVDAANLLQSAKIDPGIIAAFAQPLADSFNLYLAGKPSTSAQVQTYLGYVTVTLDQALAVYAATHPVP